MQLFFYTRFYLQLFLKWIPDRSAEAASRSKQQHVKAHNIDTREVLHSRIEYGICSEEKYRGQESAENNEVWNLYDWYDTLQSIQLTMNILRTLLIFFYYIFINIQMLFQENMIAETELLYTRAGSSISNAKDGTVVSDWRNDNKNCCSSLLFHWKILDIFFLWNRIQLFW